MSEIHIIGDPGDIDVWLDTEVAECDGIVIGVGATRDVAIASAINELEARLTDLRAQTVLDRLEPADEAAQNGLSQE